MIGKILGTGSYAPERIVTNDEMSEVVETSDEWIRTRTGICTRHIAVGESTSQMAAKASARALESAKIRAEDLDLILLATSSPDYCFPGGACEVQAALGAVRAAAFDISAACSGFVFALATANAFIKAGMYQTILIIGADCLSKLTDWSDRRTCVLFGDGAGAAVVQAVAEPVPGTGGSGIIRSVMHADGTKGPVLSCLARSGGSAFDGHSPQLGYIEMDGQEVFKFAVKKVPESIHEVLSGSGLTLDDIKCFVLHQANERIFEAIAKRLGQPMEKFPMNIACYGNTSAATVPILLDELNRDGKLTAGDKIIVAGFGGGLTWGAVLLEW